METVLGVNWRTTLTQWISAAGGILTTLAALSYQLGDIAVIISPEWKAKLVILGIFIERGAQVLNGMVQKDRMVSGNKAEGFVVATGGEVKHIDPEPPPLTKEKDSSE